MKFKGLLIAVVVLAALSGGVYWSNKAKEAADKAPPKDAPPKVLTIPDDQFKTISIRKSGGDATIVQKSGAKWEITAPKPLAADQDSVGSVVTALSSVTSDRLIEDKATDLAPYGLVSPALEVVVTKKDGKTEDLLVGDDTPTGGDAFVKLKNDPRVFSVSSGVKSSLDKSSKDLRDKRLLTFDSDKLTRVELQPATGSSVEFGKNNLNEWQILKPKPLRADGSQVEDLIRKLKDAKMDTSVSDEDAKKAAASFGSGTKVAVANVSDSAGTQTLDVRKDKDKNYYAKSSVIEGIYKVPSDLGDGLGKDLDSFRTKKLFDFGFNDPNKVSIGSTTYQKSGENWLSGGKPMDSPSVQAVIDKLRDLASTKFLDSGSGPSVLEVAVTSNDNKRNEKVSIMKQGASYIAKRENEQSVYELDPKAVEELQKTVSAVKPLQPPKEESKKKVAQVTGLLTDLYELTMAAGYFEAGKSALTGIFELSIRRLPKHRDYVLLAGLEQALEYLLNVRFSGKEIDYLRSLPQFQLIGSGFFDQLREFRFTGDVWAAPEGTVLYAGEPVLRVHAPLMEAQIPETYLLSTLTFQTLIATKAARIAQAAEGRGVVEFGTRRAHTPEAGVLGARAAYIGGCIGTSNALAGFRFGVPVMGTCAHSWVMSFPSEQEAFRKLQEVLGPYTTQLVDTYDPAEGTRRAAALGRPLWGIRLDSGDFLALSKDARAILDAAGLEDSKIMASGDLDEDRIAGLVAAGAPIDAFGVGTELATSGDAPSMGAIYKLVEIDGRDTAKWSQDKISMPGAKQLFRFPDRDVLALAEESCPPGAQALLRPVILKGQLVEAAPGLEAIRDYAAESLRAYAAAPRQVEHSSALEALMDRVKAEQK